MPSRRILVFRRRSDHEPPVELELDELDELLEPEEPLEPEPPPMPPPEPPPPELPLFSERAKAG
ncbi:hypothetical protein GFL54_11505 [Rhizobium laguerreae]|nr:hypothetical protein [Rhizobium laguerreae]OOO43757.1 hypothetical protein BS630_28015 [Rhizobium laguerreae]TBY06305.1 hypothetical protein E0I94_22120 [Rhizobium laguerreae]